VCGPRGPACYRPPLFVSESTLEAPPTSAEPAAPDRERARSRAPWTLRLFMRQHPWWSTAILLLAISVVLVAWARTRPSYDAYGWLVWGHQTLHLTLDLGGAPSWKPMPFLFTVPFALAGHYQLWLWMFYSTAVALAGAVFGGRIAYRLVRDETLASDQVPAGSNNGGPARVDRVLRYVPWAAAVSAGAAVLGIQGYVHYILSAQSDPMLVTFVLAAVDMFLLGRYRWTLVLGVLAALGRPEAWPLLGLFMLWAWFRLPRMRWMLVAGAGLIAFMWFGIPTITNGRPNISSELAKGSHRALHHNRLLGTIGRFTQLEYLPVWTAALCTVAWAAVRRRYAVLLLAASSAAWVVVEIAFAFHGWPANPRYMFEAAALAAVLVGVAVGWALLELPRVRTGLPRWAGVPAVAILAATLIPGAIARVRTERKDLFHERGRTHQIALLQTTTDVLGGSRHIRNCGEPVTDVGYVSALAWLYDTNVGFVGGFQQGVEKAALRDVSLPKVLFTPLSHGGWSVQPWHTRPGQAARCAGLHAEYASTPQGNVLIRR
jgi:hypothetical protein